MTDQNFKTTTTAPPNKEDSDDESPLVLDLSSFFTNTQYETTTITIPCHYNDETSIDNDGKNNNNNNNNNLKSSRDECSISIELSYSTSASTDYDLTGQILWPVSVLLGHYVASQKGQSLISNKNVIELGAGCGLPGLIAAHFAQTVILTDGNDIVIDLLRANCSSFRYSSSSSSSSQSTAKRQNNNNVTVSKCIWGDRNHLLDLLRQTPNIDVILAADVVQWPAVIEPLLHTMKALLWNSSSSEPACVLGIVNRAQSTYDLFFRLATTLGFTSRCVSYDEFSSEVPDGCREYGGRSTQVFEMVLTDRSKKPILLMEEGRDVFVGDEFENTSFLPC